MVNNWKTCDGCGIETRNIRLLKGMFYCYNCFQKHITQIHIVGEKILFEEPLSESVLCTFHITLTQKIKLDERLKYINPNYKINRGISNYIRTLILSDLEAFEIIKKLDKEHSEFIGVIEELKNGKI